MLLLPGWRAEVDAGEIDRARAEVRSHLESFCAAGMPVRIADGQRFYDPVALNFVCQRGLDGADPFWHDRVVAPKRAVATRLAPRSLPTERFHDPRPVTVSLRREIYYADRPPGSRVIVSLPVPTEEPTQRGVVITPDEIPGTKATVEDGLLVVRATVPDDRRVRVGARFDFTGYQQTVHIDPARLVTPTIDAALAPYLERSEGIICVTPFIEEHARRLARTNTWDTLLAFWDFIFDERKFGGFYYYALDTDDPLGSSGQWMDCNVGSALFIALARAAGIPARMVHGALLFPLVEMGLHHWSEVFLPPYGWVPFDVYAWVLAAGDKRSEWSRFSVGHLPYQLCLQRMPRGRRELGLRYPLQWYSVSAKRGAGQENSIFDIATGALVVSDYCEATIGEPPGDGA